jgi:hypothetical protein
LNLRNHGRSPLKDWQRAKGAGYLFVVLHVHPVSADYVLKVASVNEIQMESNEKTVCLEGYFLIDKVNSTIDQSIADKQKESVVSRNSTA